MTLITDSNAGTIAAELQTQLVAANIEGILANWQIFTLPEIPQATANADYEPIGVISPFDEEIRDGEGTNGQQDVVYQFLLTMAKSAKAVDPVVAKQDARLAVKLKNREDVRQLLHHKRSVLSATGLNIVDVTVVRGTLTVVPVWRKSIDATTWEVRVKVRESYQ